MKCFTLAVVLGTISAAVPSATAGTVSFSFSMNGSYAIVPETVGGATVYALALQPFAGTMPPFGNCGLSLAEVTVPTMTFTFANGTAFTATVVEQGSPSVGQPMTLNGTITGGTGILQGASGAFVGTITMVPPGTPTSIPATFTGSGTINAPNAPGGLSVLPSSLTFSVPQGSTSAVTQTLAVNNQGLSDQTFQTSETTSSGGDWLSVSPASGTVRAALTGAVAVTANPSAISKPGIYEGQVTVTYGAVSAAVSVHLVVGGLGANLVLSETGLTFQGVVGGSASHAQTLQVLNSGIGSLAGLTATTSVTGSVANWLSATVTPTADPQVSTVTVSVKALPATVGTYYGRVDLSLGSADNSPQSVTVVLQDGAGTLPQLTPTSIFLLCPDSYAFGQSGNPAAPQTLTLSNLGSRPVTYSIAGDTGYPKDGASMDWLVISPKTGTIGAASTQNITVSVSPLCFTSSYPCNLSTPVRNGWIYVTFVEDNYTAAAPVMFDIVNYMKALGITGSIAHPGARIATTCTPSGANLVSTSLLAGFQATVGLPAPLEVVAVDSCGQPMDTGTVVATFSSGDAPVTLRALGGGRWAGTWTPRKAATAATVSVQAAQTDAVTGAMQLAGSVSANTSTPIVASGGIGNAASGAGGIAPGSFIAIYGVNFGATKVASGAPYPTSLGNTQVLLGGQPLPLYFTSSGQIDAVVPYNIAANTALQLIVQNGTAYSQPETVLARTAQPGVFTQNQSGAGPGAIFGQKPGGVAALNTAANPASAGDALVIFCTGLGTVTPSVPAGTAAPLTALSWTDNPVTVTVGGLDAGFLFAGLAPGWVGLYQVNVTVPSGIAATSNAPVVVTTAGVSSAPVTVAIR